MQAKALGKGTEATMANAAIIKRSRNRRSFSRAMTHPAGWEQNGANGTFFTPAFTRFRPEHSAPLHGHHCDEQIIRLRVEGEVEVISR